LERQKEVVRALQDEARNWSAAATDREILLATLQEKIRVLEGQARSQRTQLSPQGNTGTPNTQHDWQRQEYVTPPNTRIHLAGANHEETLTTLNSRMGRAPQQVAEPPRPLQGFIPASQIGQSSQERGRDSYTGGGQGRAIPEFHAQQALPPNSGTYNPLISTPRQVCTSAVNKILWKCQSYRGQMFMETLTKEDKKMIQELKNEISQAETAVVPTSLAFAIFRFDLGELFKWAPILTREGQLQYGEELRSARSRSRAKELAITERIVDALGIDGGDAEAWDVISRDERAVTSFDRWRNLISQTAMPLIKKYWDPLLPGIYQKIQDWLRLIDREFTTVWEVTRQAITRVLWELGQQIARNFAGSFEEGKWRTMQYDLNRRTRDEVTKITWEELQKQAVSPGGNKRQKTSNTDRNGSKGGANEQPKFELSADEKVVRTALKRRMGKSIPGFDFNRAMLSKVPRHSDPGSKTWGCFFGCGGELIAADLGLKGVRLCKSKKCKRSHESKVVFPEGLKCLEGKCSESCPSRWENNK
jgi:hypothetical protein